MPSEDNWRAYLRDHSQLLNQHRAQSQAFVRGESLSVLPLKPQSKILAPANGQAFENWVDTDFPPALNWAAKFPLRSKAGVGCDIDIDVKPPGGVWNAEHARNAGLIAQHVIRGLEAFKIVTHHRWGRASQAGWGHVYLKVFAVSKDEINQLFRLHMRRPIKIGDYDVRVEVRISPDTKTTSKPITLPGSIYEAHYDDGYDPLVWQIPQKDLSPEFAFPALQPEPLSKLVKGFYAGLLTAIMAPHWAEGSRHDMALQIAGVLAREAHDPEPILDEDDAETIMRHLCTALDDDDLPDRLKVLDNSFSGLDNGRHVTGYRTLAETIGEGAKNALLRLRGDSDPDQYADLIEQVCYVPTIPGYNDAYLDLSNQGHGAVVCNQAEIIRHFHPRKRYKPRQQGRRLTPLIKILIESDDLRYYKGGIKLPGVPFGQLTIRDSHGYREASEIERAVPEDLLINYSPGFATACPDEPDLAAWKRWCYLWDRHLGPLTCYDKVQKAKLERAIAWAIQHPLEKIPLGLLLTGDGGIGKSALFDGILKPIFGDALITAVNISNLDSPYRLGNLAGTKFYVVEEIDLTHVNNPALRELLKDLMKNRMVHVNHKYGPECDVDNFAIPIFLTNVENPGLVARGAHERSLAVIKGWTQDNLNKTADEWQAIKNRIAEHIVEFIDALREPKLREAAMFYFTVQLDDVERREFEDNSDVGDVVDRRDNLEPLEEALCAMVEQNAVHPKLIDSRIAHVPLTAPFKLELLVDGLVEHMRQRGASKFRVTPHNVGRLLRRIFGDTGFASHPFKHDGKTRRISYFAMSPGDMIVSVRDKLGVTLNPDYEITSEDYGPNGPPSTEQCIAAWKFDINQVNAGSKF